MDIISISPILFILLIVLVSALIFCFFAIDVHMNSFGVVESVIIFKHHEIRMANKRGKLFKEHDKLIRVDDNYSPPEILRTYTCKKIRYNKKEERWEYYLENIDGTYADYFTNYEIESGNIRLKSELNKPFTRKKIWNKK